jgi:TrwC relaxase/AAA domain
VMAYRSFAAGDAGAAKRMAEYLSEEVAKKEMATRLAKYYGNGVMTDEGYVTQAIPRADMHPSIANLLEIDTTKPLTTAETASLLTGLTAKGNEIPDRPLPKEGQTRISAIDFCVSGPKSFDVAYALAPTDAERAILDKAFQTACDKIADVVMETVGTVKVGADSKGVREKGHVAMVSFDHYTARPTLAIANGEDTEITQPGVFGDPKRHRHMIVFSTCAADSRIGSFHQHAIKDRIHEWGALFQAYLGTELMKHGVNVELDSRQGLKFHERMLRLTDVPQSICDLFSKRTLKAEEGARQFAVDRGIDWDSLSPQQKIKLVHETAVSQRLGKEGGAHVETWRAEAAAAGYRHRSVLRPGQERQVADRVQRLPAAYDKSRQLIDELLESRAVLEGSAARVAAAKSLIATGVQDAGEVNLLTRAMRTHGVDQEGERTEIKWGFDPGLRFARLTTDKWIQMEQEAIGLIKAAAADKSPALSPEAIRTAIDEIETEARMRGEKLDFTKGHGAKQRPIIEHIGTAGRAGVVVGVAGSGKTTLMSVPIRAWHNDGRDVYGVTLGWRQTAGLEDAGIGASYQQNRQRLVDAGINQDRTFALTPFLSRMESGRMTLDKDSVLVIDEVALIGTKDMLRLLRLQQQQGFQISGIGDDRQGQSILAGASVDLFRRALGNDQVPELVSTTRQIRDQDKETSLLFRKGEAEQALRRAQQHPRPRPDP